MIWRPGTLRIAAVALMALALQAVGCLSLEGFASPFAVRALLVLACLLAVAALGQTLVVLVGGIDLAMPFVMGVANVMAAELLGRGHPFWLVLVVVVVVAALIGMGNGLLSAGLSVHPLIVTLGSGTVAQGAVLWWTRGFPTGSAPQGLSDFVSIGGSLGPLPVPALVPMTLVLVLLLQAALARTPWGRRLLATGANPGAAPFSLIQPLWVWAGAFAASAALAALAGVLLLGFTGSAHGAVGQPYLFQTIAAVVIGGTLLTGGAGSCVGTALGALVLTQINTLLIGVGLSPALVQATLGALLLVLIAVYGRERAVRDTI
ncbi:hypothetical protein ACG0Z6_11375 [Roseateles sp. BYS180W]|uniref:Autoinducer 2 import system permease protein LsrC n=1 Tax=Roseateles rivi TaxID=3299028 RepID=A0ABW7FWY7_9BURK